MCGNSNFSYYIYAHFIGKFDLKKIMYYIYTLTLNNYCNILKAVILGGVIFDRFCHTIPYSLVSYMTIVANLVTLSLELSQLLRPL